MTGTSLQKTYKEALREETEANFRLALIYLTETVMMDESARIGRNARTGDPSRPVSIADLREQVYHATMARMYRTDMQPKIVKALHEVTKSLTEVHFPDSAW